MSVGAVVVAAIVVTDDAAILALFLDQPAYTYASYVVELIVGNVHAVL